MNLGNRARLNPTLVVAAEQLPDINLTRLAVALELEIFQVTNLTQAQAFVVTHDPKILLLPVIVQGQETLNFTKLCLKRNPDLQVILVVNRNQINEAAEAMRHGVSDCLFKPFSQERLGKTLSVAAKHVDLISAGKASNMVVRAAKDLPRDAGIGSKKPEIVEGQVQASQTSPTRGQVSPDPSHFSNFLAHFHGLSLVQIERLVIEAMIKAEDGSVTRAAVILKVAPSTLYRKIQAWKILDY